MRTAKSIPNRDGSDSVRAVDRALAILLAFTPRDGGLTVSEIVARVKLSRPTLYRLLHTLERKQFLVSSGEPKRFRLGPSVAQLAHVWTASLDLGAVAQPMMRKVWEETGETVALFVADGLFRQCVAEMPSAQALSFKRGVGYRERLVLGASGRAILASTPGASQELETYAEGVKIDLKKYRHELAAVRQRGFAISRNELIQGAVAVAAPFFSGEQVAGSIGIFGPGVRLADAQAEKFGKLLVREAGRISKALGIGRASVPSG
jgi:IclR family acetate operon transcriptional repressor